jgi:hypothetical protein
MFDILPERGDFKVVRIEPDSEKAATYPKLGFHSAHQSFLQFVFEGVIQGDA